MALAEPGFVTLMKQGQNGPEYYRMPETQWQQMGGVLPPALVGQGFQVYSGGQSAPQAENGPPGHIHIPGMGELQQGEGSIDRYHGGTGVPTPQDRMRAEDEGILRIPRDNMAESLPGIFGGLAGKFTGPLGARLLGHATERAGIPGKVAAALGKDAASPMANESIKQISGALADKMLTPTQALMDTAPLAKIGALGYGAGKLGMPGWMEAMMMYPLRHQALRAIGTPAQEAVLGRTIGKVGPALGQLAGTPPLLARPQEDPTDQGR